METSKHSSHGIKLKRCQYVETEKLCTTTLKKFKSDDFVTFSEMPRTSVLEDIVEYFVSEGSHLDREIVIRVEEDQIDIDWNDANMERLNKFIQFENVNNVSCRVSTSDVANEEHRNNYIDLAVTTLMRILIAPNLSCDQISINEHTEMGMQSSVWLKFAKTVCSMRKTIQQTKIEEINLLFHSLENYTILTNSINPTLVDCLVFSESLNDCVEFETIQEAVNYCEERRITTDSWFVKIVL